MDLQRNGTVPCYLCGRSCLPSVTGLFDDRFGTSGIYDLMRCRHCGLEQTWPRPGESELKELYEQFYNWGGGRENLRTKLRDWFLFSAWYRPWLKWDGDIGFHLRQGRGRLLDVGCNEGRGLAIYAYNGFQSEGLEINERAAAMAREKGFPVHTIPLAQFTPKEPFDVVVLANVLEHVPDPLGLLSQVRRVLRPGGQVWLSCPNAASRWRRVFGRCWIHYHVPFHVWQFSPPSLKQILIRAKLHSVEIQTFTPALWLAGSICGLLDRRQGRPNRMRRSALVIAGLMLASRCFILPFLGQFDRLMAGDCLIVTAQRQ